ncbi:MAG: hypothetical protein J6Q31_01475 [Alistipes sp.]|nr:hypothetical protein [Alistipes sp.]
MKKTIILLLSIISLCYAQAQQNTANDIDKLLCELGKQDQQVRLNLNRVVQQGIADSIIIYAEMQAQIDFTNQQQVKQIIKSGIPDSLSTEAYNALFLIIDHADIRFQKHHFNTLNNLSKKGYIKPSNMATLQDRMLMLQNKKQIYGTQTVTKPIVITNDSTTIQMINYVWPVKHPTELESRRSKVGLNTMQQQKESHADFGYQMIYDPTLSKRDIQALSNSSK